MNVNPLDNKSFWPDLLLQNKCRPRWPIFHCPVIWRLFDRWTSLLYFGLMSQCDLTFDFMIYIVHHDLYFMVRWICYFDGWTSCFRTSQWNKDWPHHKYRSQWPIFHCPVIFASHLEECFIYCLVYGGVYGIWVCFLSALHLHWKSRKIYSLFPGNKICQVKAGLIAAV